MAYSDYPNSYYFASRNLDFNLPALSGEITADVCTVGGGFSGLATALYLREQGATVVLLKSNHVGWGASGRNGGQVVSGYGEDTEHLVTKIHGPEVGKRATQLGFDCLHVLYETIKRHNIQCDLTYGYVRAAITKRQENRLRQMTDCWQTMGAPGNLEFVEGTAVKELVGTPICPHDCECHSGLL